MKNIDYAIKERQSNPYTQKSYEEAAEDEYDLDNMEDFKIDGLAEFASKLQQSNIPKETTPPTAQPSSFDQFMASYTTYTKQPSASNNANPFDNFEF